MLSMLILVVVKISSFKMFEYRNAVIDTSEKLTQICVLLSIAAFEEIIRALVKKSSKFCFR